MKSSMAVNGCRRVVGVVGRGHMRGVLARLSQNHAGKFKELTWTPTRAAAKEKVWGAFVRVTRAMLAQGFDYTMRWNAQDLYIPVYIYLYLYICIGPGHSARTVGPFGDRLDRLGCTLSSLCVGFVVTEVSYSTVTEVS